MKNWLSWIVGGTVAASAGSYAAFGDLRLNLLISGNAFEQVWFCSDEDSLDSHFENEPSKQIESYKSRLIRQQGGTRFERDLKVKSRANQRNHFSTLRVFKESVGDHYKSTVQILEKHRQIALGAVVTADGWIVTKASEIPDGKIEVRLHDGSRAEGIVKARRNDLDLALVKIERKDLLAVTWNTDVDLPVGGWLISTDFRPLPVSVGVVSVASRKIPSERAFLGVKFDNESSSALIESVVEGSGADRSGMRKGDLIQSINGNSLVSKMDVLNRLERLAGGQRVDVGIQREGSTVSVSVQMMDVHRSLLDDPTEMEVNGDVSARSSGFQKVVQHDTVIAPHQCGGPVVDVNGNAVGINIARVGRVSSYALPASIASTAIAEMLASANATPSNGANVVQSTRPTPAITKTMELPASVPSTIQIEVLKPPAVELPNSLQRRQ